MSDTADLPILLVDDEPPLLARLQRILLRLGYAQDRLHRAGDIASARVSAADTRYALALIDLGLPDGNGIELIRWLRARDAAVSILVISAWSTEDMILDALRAGATGYLLKERDDLEISVSLRSAARGGAPIDPFIARRILALAAAPATGAPRTPAVPLREALTERESGILEFVAKGFSNQEIAVTLKLSRLTVETHVKRIYGKLSVHSRTEAVHEARALGLLR
jgi:DNA-binding NarL/FixJ family response regulator